MTSEQLDLDLAGLEIEVLELVPVDVSAGEHGVTEIGASSSDGSGSTAV
jgi:hypothetical protein